MAADSVVRRESTTINITTRTKKPSVTKIYIKTTPNKVGSSNDLNHAKALKQVVKVKTENRCNEIEKIQLNNREHQETTNKVIQDLEAKYLKDDDGISYVRDIKKIRKKFEHSSFDSGFFGNNNSTDEEYIPPTSPSLELEIPRKTRTIERQIPEQKHSAKYRCQPIYKPEITTTGHVYDATSPRIVSPEPLSPSSYTPRVWSPDAMSDISSLSDDSYYTSPLSRRWGSQDLEPTQEKPMYIPRSAEMKRHILEKSKRAQSITQEAQTNNNKTSETQNKVCSKAPKQYAIQRTVIGSASPKFHRTASFGMTRKTRLTPSKQTPTLYDTDFEQNKLFSFTQALGRAAERRRSGQGTLV